MMFNLHTGYTFFITAIALLTKIPIMMFLPHMLFYTNRVIQYKLQAQVHMNSSCRFLNESSGCFHVFFA